MEGAEEGGLQCADSMDGGFARRMRMFKMRPAWLYLEQT
jgi:hypothetical protein